LGIRGRDDSRLLQHFVFLSIGFSSGCIEGRRVKERFGIYSLKRINDHQRLDPPSDPTKPGRVPQSWFPAIWRDTVHVDVLVLVQEGDGCGSSERGEGKGRETRINLGERLNAEFRIHY
jgi:hypothetical protein